MSVMDEIRASATGCEDCRELLEALNHPATLDAVFELGKATARYAPFNSAHEGYAVLLEEAEELWDEIKKRQGARDIKRMRHEAVQVAAMALRFIEDVCDGGRGDV